MGKYIFLHGAFFHVLRCIYFYPVQTSLGLCLCLSWTEITRGGEDSLASVSKDLCQDFLCTPRTRAGSTSVLQARSCAFTPECHGRGAGSRTKGK